MTAALLLTLAMTGQLPATPPDDWRPLATDPRYEVKGRMRNGVFIYDPTSLRLVAVKPRNYGVTLDPAPESPLIEGSIRGTDSDLARALMERAAARHAAAPVGDRHPLDAPKPAPRPTPADSHPLAAPAAPPAAALAGPCNPDDPDEPCPPRKPLQPLDPTRSARRSLWDLEREILGVLAAVGAGVAALFLFVGLLGGLVLSALWNRIATPK